MQTLLDILHREPVWLPVARLRHGMLPADLAPWLLDSGSLTRRLRAACCGRFNVKVLSQRRSVPMRCERRLLGLPARRVALVREVLLSCGDVPWVFARTVMPPKTLVGRYRRLAHLGNRPLGELLFSDPGVRRGPLELVSLPEFPLPGRRPFWGRRSVFQAGGRPLLVSEFFMSELPTEVPR